MNLVYLVGPPGVGKTTLMAALTRGCDRTFQTTPVPHEQLRRGGEPVGLEVGRRRPGGFSGTDALAMNIQPAAVTWIATKPAPLVLGEGARLATTGFLSGARSFGYRVTVFYLHAPEYVLDDRRRERGSNQDPKWMRGATTRAANIAARMRLDADVHELDATAPTETLAAAAVKLEPALEVLNA
ncbi:P-loop-containing protein [Microbispora sp. NPDC049125]|uniref:P-loop-containing protein n=1 Tax=Microbispora sp. NPDC049125 TaxID=3154929 RepID=UPI003466EC86